MPTIVGQHLLTRKTSGDYHCPTGVGLRLLASKACSQTQADTVPVGPARPLPKGGADGGSGLGRNRRGGACGGGGARPDAGPPGGWGGSVGAGPGSQGL